MFRSPVWREILAAAPRPSAGGHRRRGRHRPRRRRAALYGLGEAPSLRDALIALGADPDAGSDELILDPDDVAAYRAVRAGIPALLERYDEVRTLFS